MARHYEQQPKATHEHAGSNPEEVAAAHEQLAQRHEQAVERDKQSPEAETSAHKEALEQAKKSPEREQDPQAHEQRETERRPLGKKHRDDTFRRTMNTVQADLSAPSRAFSKVIHNKAVERTSEALGSTIARPNAILAGSMMAFACTLGVYLVAKRYGYELSGFETIAAFVAGWLAGVLFDFLKVMITGKR